MASAVIFDLTADVGNKVSSDDMIGLMSGVSVGNSVVILGVISNFFTMLADGIFDEDTVVVIEDRSDSAPIASLEMIDAASVGSLELTEIAIGVFSVVVDRTFEFVVGISFVVITCDDVIEESLFIDAKRFSYCLRRA